MAGGELAGSPQTVEGLREGDGTAGAVVGALSEEPAAAKRMGKVRKARRGRENPKRPNFWSQKGMPLRVLAFYAVKKSDQAKEQARKLAVANQVLEIQRAQILFAADDAPQGLVSTARALRQSPANGVVTKNFRSLRCARFDRWRGATKEHSRHRAVTEEQRSYLVGGVRNPLYVPSGPVRNWLTVLPCKSAPSAKINNFS